MPILMKEMGFESLNRGDVTRISLLSLILQNWDKVKFIKLFFAILVYAFPLNGLFVLRAGFSMP